MILETNVYSIETDLAKHPLTVLFQTKHDLNGVLYLNRNDIDGLVARLMLAKTQIIEDY